MQLTTPSVRYAPDIDRAFDRFAGAEAGGLIVLPGVLNLVERDRIIARAARQGLPAVYPHRYFVTGGGLMSYGADNAEQWRQAASYVDRILKGEKAADLPVQLPTRFELVVNLKTAKSLGLTIAESFLLRADEVIE
jgi:putative ABC transport system substrate-binding protein